MKSLHLVLCRNAARKILLGRMGELTSSSIHVMAPSGALQWQPEQFEFMSPDRAVLAIRGEQQGWPPSGLARSSTAASSKFEKLTAQPERPSEAAPLPPLRRLGKFMGGIALTCPPLLLWAWCSVAACSVKKRKSISDGVHSLNSYHMISVTI